MVPEVKREKTEDSTDLFKHCDINRLNNKKKAYKFDQANRIPI